MNRMVTIVSGSLLFDGGRGNAFVSRPWTGALGAPASLPAIRKTTQAANQSPNAGKMPALPAQAGEAR